MFQSLFRRAEASVDNAVANVLGRILVAIPFLVAAGFATAAGYLYLSLEIGAVLASVVMAVVFLVSGAIAAIAVAARTSTHPPVADAATTAAEDDGYVRDPALAAAERELVSTALKVVAPLALPAVAHVMLRNLPLVAAVGAAAFILSRPSEVEAPTPLHPAE